MRLKPTPARFAERTVHGVDENGAAERIVVWIERRQGAVWAVEGYELGDALEAANGALLDDSRVSAQDGRAESVAPFDREELLKKLERWFFGHDRQSGR